MKVVILCGGMGSRISEETEHRPKPMIEIGGKPILWHIMKIYSFYGFNEFVLCLGYKGDVIKEYFLNFEIMNSDFTVEFGNSAKNVQIHNTGSTENWKVTMVDRWLGKVFEKMDEYKLWDNTMVILTSDHGHAIAERGKKILQYGKEHPIFEDVANIPLIIWVFWNVFEHP